MDRHTSSPCITTYRHLLGKSYDTAHWLDPLFPYSTILPIESTSHTIKPVHFSSRSRLHRSNQRAGRRQLHVRSTQRICLFNHIFKLCIRYNTLRTIIIILREILRHTSSGTLRLVLISLQRGSKKHLPNSRRRKETWGKGGGKKQNFQQKHLTCRKEPDHGSRL